MTTHARPARAGRIAGLPSLVGADFCKRKHRATVEMDVPNGRRHDFSPTLRASCGKKASDNRRKSR